jgi:dCMP deaminase
MDAKRLTEIDKTYLRMAYEWASLSRAKRMQVGCLVVKDRMIISDGFNGTPTGFDNTCETENTVMNIMIGKDKTITKPEVLHAESNAITKLAKSTQTSEGATMYLTLSPCLDCAKLIIQAGIKRVVYSEQYRIQYGIILLKQGNISIEHLEVEV